MTEKKIKKKYRLKLRFYLVVFGFLILGHLGFSFLGRVQADRLPNFHGWLAEEVMEFERQHPNISIIYQLEYSEVIRPTRVFGQSVPPGTRIDETPIVLTVQVSKGIPANE